MCLVPANIKELEEKGVASHILQRDLGGYWDHVMTVHPFCDREQVFELADNHTVLELKRTQILKNIWRLRRLALYYNVSAVKAHDPYWIGLLGLIVSRLCGVPLVVMICSSYELVWRLVRKHANGIIKSRLLDKVLGWVVMRKADMVFGGSCDAARWALSNGARIGRTFVVRTQGVDERHFGPLESRQDMREELGVNGRIVLFAGRLSPEKFPKDAVRAFNYVRWSTIGSRLLLVGDGPLREDMEQYVERVPFDAGAIIFVGFQSQKELANLYYTADVILAPLAGSGLTEACLSGTPVVAYAVDWHPELIQDGETGLLVRYRDYKAMGEAVVRLLNDRDLGERLGRNAREKALRQHSLDVVQGQEREFFTWMLSGKFRRKAYAKD